VKTFDSDGVEIAFVDEGPREGSRESHADTVLLIHGFASNVATNWVGPGWVKALTEAGHRVIAYDNRGHGRSAKLYDIKDYGAPLMAEDARRLLDHLGIARADVMGYSMGARIAAFLAIAHPERVRSLVFAGLGINMVRGVAGTGPVARALEAASIDDVGNPTARTFRAFAEQTQSDLKALAACIRSARAPITAEALGALTCPVLVVVGEDDVIGGDPAPLAALMPNARAVVVPGRDHMRTVGDKAYRQAVLEFLRTRA
jgi:pimeloyl-ACP methyl ester carboxylesterase